MEGVIESPKAWTSLNIHQQDHFDVPDVRRDHSLQSTNKRVAQNWTSNTLVPL